MTPIKFYRNFTSSALILAAASVLLVGCTATKPMGLSNSLSSETQLQLDAVEEESVNFQFSPNANGERVEISNGAVSKVYSVNSTLEGRIQQLLRAKFQSVSESSDNTVSISIESVNASNDLATLGNTGTHSVEVEMLAEITKGGETATRSIKRDATLNFEQVGEGFEASLEIDERKLEEFMSQFVVGVNSFVDANFDVD